MGIFVNTNSQVTKAPAAPIRRRQLSVDDYVEGVLAGDRAILGRAITLIESVSRKHQALAQEVLVKLLPHTGNSQRIGITGVPGVGKSTFIEGFGMYLTGEGHQVAVLAIDPSSNVSGGSILGDKTRMVELSANPKAFIRPSPSSCTLGGVTRRTRETMLLCEAAGYDVILIETVGVGQSETVVAEMVDFFLVLMLAGAGDELQGIKRGVLELAEMIAINKSDGDNARNAARARAEYENALHYMRPASEHWSVPVVTCSGLKGMGLDTIWAKIGEHRSNLTASGEITERRRVQMVRWMWNMVEDQLKSALRDHDGVCKILGKLEDAVSQGKTTPTIAAHDILTAFLGDPPKFD